MTLKDQFGNPVSTQSRAAIEQFDRAVNQLNQFRIDPLATIDAALAEDPAFVMGHCFKASMLTTTTERGTEGALQSSIEAAEQHASHALDRERMYIGAARAWLAGDFARSVKLYGEIAAQFPRDLLALQIAHLGDFYLGHASLLRDRPAQVLPAWSENESGRGFVLGMYAFGLEECGRYAQAEAHGRRAVELNPGDAWGVHAVTHVYEMDGRTQEGFNWLQSTSNGWAPDNFLAFHNWWHLALFHLETENHSAALHVYDKHIRPTPTRAAVEMLDAAALLWRLRLRSVDVGDRWRELASSWEAFGEDGYYAFNDVHAVMAFLATGKEQELRRVIAGLEAAANGSGTNAMMSREVGLPVARGLCAFEREDYDTALDELLLVRGHAHRFGGSHAQRDLLNLTLVEAAIRAGRHSLARAFASERLAAKPDSAFNRRLLRRVGTPEATGSSQAA